MPASSLGVVPASSWSSNRLLTILVGATAGALSPLDVLVIGCQDCLQLRLEGVRLHFGISIYHSALVLKCKCIDAVLERNRNRVDDESTQMWLYSCIFQPTKYSPEAYVDSSVHMTMPMKSNKPCNNWFNVYLHFLLVVEVFKWNRILDLLMTLDATYYDVQLIYGLAEIS